MADQKGNAIIFIHVECENAGRACAFLDLDKVGNLVPVYPSREKKDGGS